MKQIRTKVSYEKFYLQIASSVLFKFSCTSEELFNSELKTFSSQMFLGCSSNLINFSVIKIIKSIILHFHQILNVNNYLPLSKSAIFRSNWVICKMFTSVIVTFLESIKFVKSTTNASGSNSKDWSLISGTEKQKRCQSKTFIFYGNYTCLNEWLRTGLEFYIEFSQ